jgi:hypothetical protein
MADIQEERCGSMREGGDMQCVYLAGHSELHQWGAMPAWAFIDEEDSADNEEGLQEMPQVLSDSRCEVQGEAEGEVNG